MVFDECTEYPADRERARRSLDLTLQRAARSKHYFEAHKHEVPGPRRCADARNRCSGSCTEEYIRSCDVNRRSD